MNLRKIGEFGFIEQLSQLLRPGNDVVKGIGDDAAVLPRDKSTYALFTCDALVEGIHFTLNMPAHLIGRKAMAVNLSDIASMGGIPQHAVVTLGVKPTLPLRFYQKLYQGLQEVASLFGVTVVGGDTVSSPKALFVDVALTGWVEKKHCTLRQGAQRGDALVVSGSLGGSLAGKHLQFTPRIKEARALVKHFSVHAMIDLSDGLAGDLGHILKQSHVGARIFLNRIPIARSVTAKGFLPRLRQALCDGEDYELLFALPAKQAASAQAFFARHKGFPCLRVVGEVIRASQGLRYVFPDGKEKKWDLHGYQHF